MSTGFQSLIFWYHGGKSAGLVKKQPRIVSGAVGESLHYFVKELRFSLTKSCVSMMKSACSFAIA